MRRAFTLLELLIVVAVIAVLAAISVPNFLEAQVRAKVSRTHMDAATLRSALANYRADFGEYPPNLLFDRIGVPSPDVVYKTQGLDEMASHHTLDDLPAGWELFLGEHSPGWRRGYYQTPPKYNFFWPSYLESSEPPTEEEEEQPADFSEGPPEGMDPMEWEMMMMYGMGQSDPFGGANNAAGAKKQYPANHVSYDTALRPLIEQNSVLSLFPLVDAPRDAGYLTGGLKGEVFRPKPAALQYLRIEPMIGENAPAQRDGFTTTTLTQRIAWVTDIHHPKQPYLIMGVGPDQDLIDHGLVSYDPTNGTISTGDLIYGEHGRIHNLY